MAEEAKIQAEPQREQKEASKQEGITLAELATKINAIMVKLNEVDEAVGNLLPVGYVDEVLKTDIVLAFMRAATVTDRALAEKVKTVVQALERV